MKVYIVTQSWGSYSDYTEVIIGVVSSMEKAKELAMKAEPTYDVSTVEVRCFELDGKCHTFSKAEREAYKFTDSFDYYDSKYLELINKVEKMEEQLNIAKKHIEHIITNIKNDGHLRTIKKDWILPDLEKALAAIGGDDE